MVAMFGAMAVLRRIDQEEPLVLLYARIGYLLYVAVTSVLYCLLHFRIVAQRDTTLITVPIVQKAPSFSEAMEKARKAAEAAEAEKRGELIGNNDDDDDDDQSTTTTTTTTTNNNDDSSKDGEENSSSTTENNNNKMETITVMEYDLRHLSSARRSWATSSCFLAAVHYHMQSVSPLAMAAIMGIIRLLTEEPLVQIHLRGAPATDKLKRPFTPEKNPLATMLNDMAPKDGESSGTTSSSTTTTTTTTTPTNTTATSGTALTGGRVQNGQAPSNNNVNDDLHDDGDDDDDDDEVPPVMSTSIKDDHIKSDFDDEDDDAADVSQLTKKAQ